RSSRTSPSRWTRFESNRPIPLWASRSRLHPGWRPGVPSQRLQARRRPVRSERMEENPSSPSDPFDPAKIHYLVRLMKRYDLTDLDLQNGQARIRLKRRGPETASPPVGPAQPMSGPAVGPTPVSPPALPTPESPPSAASKTVVIESPMVGTYYTSSAPDAPPFVTTGSVVHQDTI